MAVEYKVWIDVEEYNDETEEYRNLDLGFEGTAWFPDEAGATAFAHMMDRIGIIIDSSTGAHDVSHDEMLAEIGGYIDDWRRGRTDAPPATGLSPDIIITDDGEGDANQRH